MSLKAAEVVLQLDSSTPAYRARQRFHLSEGKLSIELSVTHLAERAAWHGLGLHPYLPRTPYPIAGGSARCGFATRQNCRHGLASCLPNGFSKHLGVAGNAGRQRLLRMGRPLPDSATGPAAMNWSAVSGSRQPALLPARPGFFLHRAGQPPGQRPPPARSAGAAFTEQRRKSPNSVSPCTIERLNPAVDPNTHAARFGLHRFS